MKTMFCLIVLFFCFSQLCAATLLSESFSTPPTIPTGWTATGPIVSIWSVNYSNFAGGTASSELCLNYGTVSQVGTYRIISPAIDTRKVHEMTLSFRQMLDDFPFYDNPYTIGVQISTDLSTWTNLWSTVVSTASIPAEQRTITIPYSLGMSETTYISFFLTGDPFWAINNWYIDDVLLTYENTLGSGSWTTNNYNITGDLLVPLGKTLQIAAGSNLYFGLEKQLKVEGRLLVNGTAAQPVLFSEAVIEEHWKGMKFWNSSMAADSSIVNYATITKANDSGIMAFQSNKIRISNCLIDNNDGSMGGGVCLQSGSVLLENSTITLNASLGLGAAVYSSGNLHTIRNCTIQDNISLPHANANALFLDGCNLDLIHDNIIANNYVYESPGTLKAVYMTNCSGSFKRNLVACNDGTGIAVIGGSFSVIDHCDIVYNNGYGLYRFGPVNVSSSIIWGNATNSIIDDTFPTSLQIGYSCVQNGISGITNGISPSNYVANIAVNPLFVHPIAMLGVDVLTGDWNLQPLSPCIDTGYYVETDPDGSYADMGIYYRLVSPQITRAQDYSPDQGHQLDLKWTKSPLQTTFSPGAYYTVWRLGETSRNANTLYVANPSLLSEALINGDNEVCWRDGARTWYFLNQVPAYNFDDYGLIVPTLRDSSSTGTNEAEYMVIYQNSLGFWTSRTKWGYSVDNIPPATAERLLLANTGINQYRLNWNRVTEGYWEGNSYPEINTITYKIYAGDSPDFPTDSSSFLLSTTNPTVILNGQTGSKKFYRIIAGDSE
jgi:hypothetical protein